MNRRKQSEHHDRNAIENPYAPSQTLGERPASRTQKWLVAWRVYIIFHAILVVIFLAWIRNQYDPSNAYVNVGADTQIVFAEFMNWLALVAFLMAFISPFVVFVLLFTAARRGYLPKGS